MKYTAYGFTFVGRRERNEDALWLDSDLGAFAVADGMGGHAGGREASSLALRSVSEVFEQARGGLELTWPLGFDANLSFEESLMDMAVDTANRAIIQNRSGKLKKMGSTLAMLLLRDGEAVVGHIGDSRVYRLRNGLLDQVTDDHSLYEDLVRAGTANMPPKSRFSMKNVITRVLGRQGTFADRMVLDVREGDTFLLCTDGLTDVLGPEVIQPVLEGLEPEEAAKHLVNEAFLRGSRDNITALVVRAQGAVHRGRAAFEDERQVA